MAYDFVKSVKVCDSLWYMFFSLFIFVRCWEIQLSSERFCNPIKLLNSGASFPFTDFDYPLGIFKLFLLVLIKGIDLVGLIRCCLTASEQYFTNMHKQTKFTDNASCRWRDGTVMSLRAEVLIAMRKRIVSYTRLIHCIITLPFSLDRKSHDTDIYLSECHNAV